jgi:hypothetical protein
MNAGDSADIRVWRDDGMEEEVDVDVEEEEDDDVDEEDVDGCD